MADEGTGNPPLELNKDWIRKFLDNDVTDFQSALKKILTDKVDPDPSTILQSLFSGPAMFSLLSEVPTVKNMMKGGSKPDSVLEESEWPLIIGLMGKGELNGDSVLSGVQDTAETLTEFLEGQQTLFNDIEYALEDTIDTLFGTQGDNLEKIDGQKMIDIFEDVDDDLTSDSSSGGSGSGDSDDEDEDDD